MKLRLWPSSLAGRTALTLIAGFAVVQAFGLGIHTFNEMNLERLAEQQRIATQDVRIYQQIAQAAPAERAGLLKHLNTGPALVVALAQRPDRRDTFTLPLSARQIILGSFFSAGYGHFVHPHGLVLRGRFDPPRVIASLRLPETNTADRTWLIIATRFIPPEPWRSPGFATAFIAMFLLGVPLIFWAVHHLTAPIRTLSSAAEQLVVCAIDFAVNLCIDPSVKLEGFDLWLPKRSP